MQKRKRTVWIEKTLEKYVLEQTDGERRYIEKTLERKIDREDYRKYIVKTLERKR